ncbi:MAG: GntR family transcriptional regulator, partial [Thermoanaerobaculia bacterium]
MRRAHHIPLPWVRVDRELGISAERQICGALRQAIRQGLLARGFRLPSVRQLAQDLDVSRRVIVNAYQRLEDEGYVATNRGCGTHVAS